MRISILLFLLTLMFGSAIFAAPQKSDGWILLTESVVGKNQQMSERHWVVRADGKEKTAFIPSPQRRQISPDGEKWCGIGYQEGWATVRGSKYLLYVGRQGENSDTAKVLIGKGAIDEVQWTPDGNILLSSGEIDWDGGIKHLTLSLIDSETGTVLQNFQDFRSGIPAIRGKIESDAAISPDGKKILFVASSAVISNDAGDYEVDSTSYLILFDLATKKARKAKVVAAFRNIQKPRWSPNGQQFIFTAGNADSPRKTFNSDIYVGDSNNLDLTQLTFSAFRDSLADWSPDGKQIVWLSSRPLKNVKDGRLRPYIMDANGSNQHILLSNVNATSVSWQKHKPK